MRALLWVIGVFASLGVIFTTFENTPYSAQAFVDMLGFAIAWFQAGGNMLGTRCFDAYVEAWAVRKAT